MERSKPIKRLKRLHVSQERKRRHLIGAGFARLYRLLPCYRNQEHESSNNVRRNNGDAVPSKLFLLQAAADYIHQLKAASSVQRVAELQRQLDALRQRTSTCGRCRTLHAADSRARNAGLSPAREGQRRGGGRRDSGQSVGDAATATVVGASCVAKHGAAGTIVAQPAMLTQLLLTSPQQQQQQTVLLLVTSNDAHALVAPPASGHVPIAPKPATTAITTCDVSTEGKPMPAGSAMLPFGDSSPVADAVRDDVALQHTPCSSVSARNQSCSPHLHDDVTVSSQSATDLTHGRNMISRDCSSPVITIAAPLSPAASHLSTVSCHVGELSRVVVSPRPSPVRFVKAARLGAAVSGGCGGLPSITCVSPRNSHVTRSICVTAATSITKPVCTSADSVAMTTKCHNTATINSVAMTTKCHNTATINSVAMTTKCHNTTTINSVAMTTKCHNTATINSVAMITKCHNTATINSVAVTTKCHNTTTINSVAMTTKCHSTATINSVAMTTKCHNTSAINSVAMATKCHNTTTGNSVAMATKCHNTATGNSVAMTTSLHSTPTTGVGGGNCVCVSVCCERMCSSVSGREPVYITRARTSGAELVAPASTPPVRRHQSPPSTTCSVCVGDRVISYPALSSSVFPSSSSSLSSSTSRACPVNQMSVVSCAPVCMSVCQSPTHSSPVVSSCVTNADDICAVTSASGRVTSANCLVSLPLHGASSAPAAVTARSSYGAASSGAESTLVSASPAYTPTAATRPAYISSWYPANATSLPYHTTSCSTIEHKSSKSWAVSRPAASSHCSLSLPRGYAALPHSLSSHFPALPHSAVSLPLVSGSSAHASVALPHYSMSIPHASVSSSSASSTLHNNLVSPATSTSHTSLALPHYSAALPHTASVSLPLCSALPRTSFTLSSSSSSLPISSAITQSTSLPLSHCLTTLPHIPVTLPGSLAHSSGSLIFNSTPMLDSTVSLPYSSVSFSSAPITLPASSLLFHSTPVSYPSFIPSSTSLQLGAVSLSSASCFLPSRPCSSAVDHSFSLSRTSAGSYASPAVSCCTDMLRSHETHQATRKSSTHATDTSRSAAVPVSSVCVASCPVSQRVVSQCSSISHRPVSTALPHTSSSRTAVSNRSAVVYAARPGSTSLASKTTPDGMSVAVTTRQTTSVTSASVTSASCSMLGVSATASAVESDVGKSLSVSASQSSCCVTHTSVSSSTSSSDVVASVPAILSADTVNTTLEQCVSRSANVQLSSCFTSARTPGNAALCSDVLTCQTTATTHRQHQLQQRPSHQTTTMKHVSHAASASPNDRRFLIDTLCSSPATGVPAAGGCGVAATDAAAAVCSLVSAASAPALCPAAAGANTASVAASVTSQAQRHRDRRTRRRSVGAASQMSTSVAGAANVCATSATKTTHSTRAACDGAALCDERRPSNLDSAATTGALSGAVSSSTCGVYGAAWPSAVNNDAHAQYLTQPFVYSHYHHHYQQQQQQQQQHYQAQQHNNTNNTPQQQQHYHSQLRQRQFTSYNHNQQQQHGITHQPYHTSHNHLYLDGMNRPLNTGHNAHSHPVTYDGRHLQHSSSTNSAGIGYESGGGVAGYYHNTPSTFYPASDAAVYFNTTYQQPQQPQCDASLQWRPSQSLTDVASCVPVTSAVTAAATSSSKTARPQVATAAGKRSGAGLKRGRHHTPVIDEPASSQSLFSVCRLVNDHKHCGAGSKRPRPSTNYSAEALLASADVSELGDLCLPLLTSSVTTASHTSVSHSAISTSAASFSSASERRLDELLGTSSLFDCAPLVGGGCVSRPPGPSPAAAAGVDDTAANLLAPFFTRPPDQSAATAGGGGDVSCWQMAVTAAGGSCSDSSLAPSIAAAAASCVTNFNLSHLLPDIGNKMTAGGLSMTTPPRMSSHASSTLCTSSSTSASVVMTSPLASSSVAEFPCFLSADLRSSYPTR